jgi:hypothetical protein
MDERNPYAPPTAAVADIDNASTSTVAVDAPFFAVTLFKYVLMFVCTFGLYQIYWFYKNWQLIKEREGFAGIRISPLPRGIFSVFFCYQCFAKIRDYEHPAVQPRRLLAGPLAAGWIILSLLWRLPDPWWWPSTVSFLFILPVQRRVNQINAEVAPEQDRNGRLTWLNWIGVGVGSLLLLLILIGTLAPPQDVD